ncbi:putative N-acetyltransferase p20 [Ananas comosus]|nr:putative N-acetyltransferase p20 [Ananas comosus]
MEQSQEEPTKKPPPPLRSSPPAIILRRFEPSPSDATTLFSWASDPRVTRFLRRGPVPDSDAALRYITDHILPHPWYRAICVPPSDTPVGSISIKPGPVQEKNTRFRSASVGYRLAHAHWGRGIATAALRAVAAAAAFAEWLQLDRLKAVADVENLASQRVLEKAGFRREGVLRKYVRLKGEETRDVVMYSLLSTDDTNE